MESLYCEVKVRLVQMKSLRAVCVNVDVCVCVCVCVRVVAALLTVFLLSLSLSHPYALSVTDFDGLSYPLNWSRAPGGNT